jgi:hypothetical protein
MKAISALKAICWTITICFLLGCNKEKLNRAIANSGPSYNYGSSLTSYQVSLKRVNQYPAGSKIIIERFGFPNADSSIIYTNAILDNSLPINDTSFSRVELVNYTLYLKWKILSANKDSLSGGTTPRLTTTATPIIFEIKY